MADCIAPRLRIQNLLADVNIPTDYFQELQTTYVMYRVINGEMDSLPKALNYSFIEHILRACTTKADEKILLDTLPRKIAKAVRPLVKAKSQQSPQLAIHKLQTYEIDWASFSARQFAFINLLEATDDHVTASYLGPNEVGTWPIFNFLDSRQVQKTIILYTHELWYIDGYDNMDDEVHVPLIPAGMLKTYRTRLTRPWMYKRKVVQQKPSNEPRTKVEVDCQTPKLVKKGNATKLKNGKLVVAGVIYESGIAKEIKAIQEPQKLSSLRAEDIRNLGTEEIPSMRKSNLSKKTPSTQAISERKVVSARNRYKDNKTSTALARTESQASIPLWRDYEDALEANPTRRREGCVAVMEDCSLL